MKRFIGIIFLGTLAFRAAAQEIVVRVAPPHAIHERRERSPGRDYVWVSGYHRWDGHAYAWNGGGWEQPPRPHAHWQAHRWVHRHDGWVLEEGRWR
jgi:hypothetical protein